jgi:hypothetical protein
MGFDRGMARLVRSVFVGDENANTRTGLASDLSHSGPPHRNKFAKSQIQFHRKENPSRPNLLSLLEPENCRLAVRNRFTRPQFVESRS